MRCRSIASIHRRFRSLGWLHVHNRMARRVACVSHGSWGDRNGWTRLHRRHLRNLSRVKWSFPWTKRHRRQGELRLRWRSCGYWSRAAFEAAVAGFVWTTAPKSMSANHSPSAGDDVTFTRTGTCVTPWSHRPHRTTRQWEWELSRNRGQQKHVHKWKTSHCATWKGATRSDTGCSSQDCRCNAQNISATGNSVEHV